MLSLQYFIRILYLSMQFEFLSGCERALYAADIVYLLDSSGSVHENNFKKQLNFISAFVKSIPIGPNNIQIGIESFSDTIHHHFDLDDYLNETLLDEAVQNVPYIKGKTNTADGLRWVMEHSFTNLTGNREDVHDILIVTTDGKSNNKRETLKAAAELHARNLTTLCIGIGKGVANDEIRSIASSPDDAILVRDFDLLLTTVLNLTLTEMESYACGGFMTTTESTAETVDDTELPSAIKIIRKVEIGVLGVISTIILSSTICCCRKFWAALKRRNDYDDDEDRKSASKSKIGYPNVSVSPLPILKDDVKAYPTHTLYFENGEW